MFIVVLLGLLALIISAVIAIRWKRAKGERFHQPELLWTNGMEKPEWNLILKTWIDFSLFLGKKMETNENPVSYIIIS